MKEIALSSIDTMENAPADLYQNKSVIENIEAVTATVSTAVYQIDDAGRKQSKADVASVRKLVTNLKKHVKATFEEESKAPILWRDTITGKLNTLLEEVKKIPAQFEESERKKLEEIKELLILEIAHAWNDAGVKNEYQSDLSVLDKAILLSSLTAKGSLTKKAKDYVQSVCEKNLKKQTLVDSRYIVLENLCMKAGVEALALTQEYIGPAFFADDETFNSRVDELLAIEVKKKQDAEQRIEAEKQKAIGEALAKQQAEADRKAQEKAEQERLANQTSTAATEVQEQTTEAKEVPEQPKVTVTPIKKEQPVIPGKHPVHVTFTLETMIRDGVSDEAVAQHFINNVLPEILVKDLVSHSAITVKKAS